MDDMMVDKNDAGGLLRPLFILLMCILLFVPINYVMIAVHEGGHAFAALATGGWATKIVLYPSLWTGGETYCGGSQYEEFAWAGGMLATGLLGLIAGLRGGWFYRYVALICGARLFVGYAKLYLYGGWSDTTALLQMGTPMAAFMLALVTSLALAAIALAIWNDGEPADI